MVSAGRGQGKVTEQLPGAQTGDQQAGLGPARLRVHATDCGTEDRTQQQQHDQWAAGRSHAPGRGMGDGRGQCRACADKTTAQARGMLGRRAHLRNPTVQSEQGICRGALG